MRKGSCRHTSTCACDLKHYDKVTVKALRWKVFTMADYILASQTRTSSGPTANVIARSRSNRGSSSRGSSSQTNGKHFILPEAWRQELLAEIKQDEDTIPHDLLLWEAS
jgi:hypothetical protein